MMRAPEKEKLPRNSVFLVSVSDIRLTKCNQILFLCAFCQYIIDFQWSYPSLFHIAEVLNRSSGLGVWDYDIRMELVRNSRVAYARACCSFVAL